MTKDEALEAAAVLHPCEPGESATGATERWVEIMDDETRPGPVRDVRCWVVEFSGDPGPTVDLYIDVETAEEVKRLAY